jgi:prepilin-type N-terminal cleavage/methylation domain-containing protein
VIVLKNKAFTLIELLAVIVVLAIIMAIAVPSISSLIGSAKRNTFDSDAKLIIKSIENKILEDPSIDVSELNKENISSVIGISDENIKDISVSDTSGDIQVAITGQNKWNNYVACGSYTDMSVSEGDYCTGIIPADDSCFTFDSATGTITDYSESCSGDVVIPNEINDVNVEHIAPGAFTYRQNHYCYYYSESGTVQDQVALDYVHQEGDGYEYCWYGTDDTNITSLVLPKYLKTIGYTAFNGGQLTSLVIPNSVTDIGVASFANNLIQTLTIGNNVATIDQFAFKNNQITKVEIPNSVTTLDQQAFCFNQIASVNFGTGLQKIGTSAFYSNQLTSLVLPDQITEIWSYAFGLNQLSNIEFGTGLKIIGGAAFLDNNFTTMNFPEGVTTIYSYAFEDNPLVSVSIPSTVSLIDYSIVGNPSLTTITVSSSNPSFKSINNGVYSKDGKTLIIGTKSMSNNIENTVITLKDDCFWNMGITSVTIPTSVTTIGTWAFADNLLTSVAVPNSVTSIGTSAFRYNNILQGNATIDRVSGTVTIGQYAFDNNGASKTTTITPVYLR